MLSRDYSSHFFLQRSSKVASDMGNWLYVPLRDLQSLKEEVTDELAKLKQQLNDVKKMVRVDNTLDVTEKIEELEKKVAALHDRVSSMRKDIEINRTRSQLNYKTIGTHENLMRARMDRMQSDIDSLNALTQQELQRRAETKRV